MRFGCVVLQDRPFEELKRDWQTIEDAGFDNLWIADHVMTFPQMGSLLEAWTTLGAMAACTSRIRIGTLVTNITYRNPSVLAKEAITVDHLSNGRLEVGIGAAGTRADDAHVAGIDEWSIAERADRFEEFVEIVDSLLAGRSDAFSGEYYRAKGFDRGEWPVQSPRPPLVIAAHGPRTLRVAARFADTWNVQAGFGRQGDDLLFFLRDCNEMLDSFVAEAGRDPEAIRRSLLVSDSGFPWWESSDALTDFLGAVTSTGIQDFVFYYPPYGDAAGKIAPARLLELIAEVAPGFRAH
jgi:alkanesulfonate monooxygenase SsuD/methylene tetrahydromethanopterin reductase-like flavin-dependent oxidoreductase (luciferase family)